MLCKACGNTEEFIEVRHMHWRVKYTDGKRNDRPTVPYKTVVELFCGQCQQLVLQSQ